MRNLGITFREYRKGVQDEVINNIHRINPEVVTDIVTEVVTKYLKNYLENKKSSSIFEKKSDQQQNSI
jgi:hypothetical protein